MRRSLHGIGLASVIGLGVLATSARAELDACVTGAIQFVPTGTEPIVGHIEVTNQLCQPSSTWMDWEIETSIGKITVSYEQTANYDCTPGCPDTLSIWGLPEGYSAYPSSVVVAEESSDRIPIFIYLGN